MGAAWARHAMCESGFTLSLVCVCVCVCVRVCVCATRYLNFISERVSVREVPRMLYCVPALWVTVS